MEPEEAVAVGVAAPLSARGRHIKKRALRNKALSISFDEKDLTNFVTGFHKRKKKRRKEAELQLQEALRKKRIEARKKRKMEREFALYGESGAPPDSDAGPDEGDEEPEEDEESEVNASVSGTTMYDNGDLQVTVTTSEISREEEFPSEVLHPVGATASEGFERRKQKIPVIKKKPLKKPAKRRSQRKPQSKRDKRKGKTKSKKH